MYEDGYRIVLLLRCVEGSGKNSTGTWKEYHVHTVSKVGTDGKEEISGCVIAFIYDELELYAPEWLELNLEVGQEVYIYCMLKMLRLAMTKKEAKKGRVYKWNNVNVYKLPKNRQVVFATNAKRWMFKVRFRRNRAGRYWWEDVETGEVDETAVVRWMPWPSGMSEEEVHAESDTSLQWYNSSNVSYVGGGR